MNTELIKALVATGDTLQLLGTIKACKSAEISITVINSEEQSSKVELFATTGVTPEKVDTVDTAVIPESGGSLDRSFVAVAGEKIYIKSAQAGLIARILVKYNY